MGIKNIVTNNFFKIVQKEIDTFYNQKFLSFLYSNYLYKFDNDFIKNPLKKKTTKKEKNKEYIIELFSKVLLDKELCLQLFNLFPQEIKDIFHILFNYPKIYNLVSYVESELNIKIFKTLDKSDYDIELASRELNIFFYRYIYDKEKTIIFLPDNIKECFRDCIKFETIDLNKGFENIKNSFIYSNEDFILNELPHICMCIYKGEVKFSKNNNNILITSLKRLQNLSNIKEFTDINANKSPFFLLRTKILFEFLTNFENLNKQQNKQDFVFLLKKIILYGLDKYNVLELNVLFPCINIKNYYGCDFRKYSYDLMKGFNSILSILPINLWIDVENIIKIFYRNQTNMRELENFFIDTAKLRNKYIKQRFNSDFYYNELSEIDYFLFDEAVIYPFIKGFLFLLSALGVLDISFNPNDEAKDGNIYDSLKYVRLTNLGAHLLGRLKDYSPNIKKDESKFIFDDKNLIVSVQGDGFGIKESIIKDYAKPIGPRRFRLDYETILNGCKSIEDIDKKIAVFKQDICPIPKDNIKIFLESIKKKIAPLTPLEDMVVFSIDNKDPEFILLLRKDSYLRKYILKVENNMLAIHFKNFSKVKAYLKKFGYSC